MQVRGDRGLVAGLVLLPVIGFVIAGIVVLVMQSSANDEGMTRGAWQTAHDFYQALSKRDVQAAADLTDDPDDAQDQLQLLVDKLPKGAKLSSVVGDVKRKTETASGKATMSWTFGGGRKFTYRTKVALTKDDQWQISWAPSLVHPELREGQYMSVVRRTDQAAVVDRDGKPLVTWKDGKTVESRPGRAGVFKNSMVQRATALGAPANWGVAAVGEDGKRADYLSGKGPGQTKALTIDVGIGVQDTAQSVVDKQRSPAALVAIKPSTGAILAVAQNAPAFQGGPIALSGLYPPGKLMDVVQTAAGGKASGKKLVKAADSLGMNADFDVPPVKTELGAVRSDDAKLSPLGAAMMATTISSGKAVTPQLWPDQRTKVLTKYSPPTPETVRALQDSLRSADGLGKAYDAKGPHGKTEGWYIGSRGDMAFALLIDGSGGAPAADKAAHDFLGKVPKS